MPDFIRRIPEGDQVARLVCADCGHVVYENPKIVVGSVVVEAGAAPRVLLCRRAILPRRGFWTLPAGYLENQETVEEGARREAAEEACVDITLRGLLAIYSISRLSQVQIIYLAGFTDAAATPLFSPGPESQEVRLFAWEDIPWADLAFPSVHWALRAWYALAGALPAMPAGNPAQDPRGVGALAPEAIGGAALPGTALPGTALP